MSKEGSMENNKKENHVDEGRMDAFMDRALHPITILAVLIIVIGVYVIKFYKMPISSSPQEWGPFGDYVGGILNPAVALAALWWLRRSFSIQKIELLETRKALRDQADSQKESVMALREQINNQLRLARIETVNTELSGVESELAFYRSVINEVSSIIPNASLSFINVLDGTFIWSTDIIQTQQYLSSMWDMMRSARDRKVALINEAQGIALKMSGDQVKKLKEQGRWPLTNSDIEGLVAAGAILK